MQGKEQVWEKLKVDAKQMYVKNIYLLKFFFIIVSRAKNIDTKTRYIIHKKIGIEKPKQ